MRFGIVGDDDTGSSDAASMLTRHGVRTALVVDWRGCGKHVAELEKYDAIVVGTQARSVAPREAYRRTAEAIEFLRRFGPEKIQIKYCSTFDSTPQGNIGPTIDAAMDVLRAERTIVCPALPVNGRTVYNGHLFVGDTLLSESPLRHHPLNPMTDSNIVRWLQRQTRRRVGLLGTSDYNQGTDGIARRLDALREEGVPYIVTDATGEVDLIQLARTTADWPLITGGSGITNWVGQTLFPRRRPPAYGRRLAGLAPGTLVVAGSMSPATRRQNAYARRHGFVGCAVDPIAVLDGRFDERAMVQRVRRLIDRERDVLLYSSTAGASVARVHAHGTAKGLTPTEAGRRIEAALAGVALGVVGGGDAGRLVVSGGETSGHVCSEFAFSALEVGQPIAPGVPFCFPMGYSNLMVVLKSGNFGPEDFYVRVRDLR